MLYVNDLLIKKDSSQWKRYDEFKREVLSKFKNPVIIRTGRPVVFNENGLPEALPLEWIPLDQELTGPDGGEHWRYCDRPPRKRADGNFSYSPRGKTMKSAWPLDKVRDSELIFFFHELSSFRKNGSLVFEDKKKEARQTLAKETADLDVRWLITSKSSPISVEQTKSEDILRMAAAAWGVENAHDTDKSIDEIKVALLDTVKASEKNKAATGRGYDEFMEEVNSQDRLSVMANVQKALDTGVIVYDKPTFSWRFVSTNIPITTVPVSAAANPKAALNKFLSLNEKSAKILELSLSDSYLSQDTPEKGEDMTAEKLGKLNYAELRSFGKTVGVNAHGKKQPDVLNEIIEKLSL